MHSRHDFLDTSFNPSHLYRKVVTLGLTWTIVAIGAFVPGKIILKQMGEKPAVLKSEKCLLAALVEVMVDPNIYISAVKRA